MLNWKVVFAYLVAWIPSFGSLSQAGTVERTLFGPLPYLGRDDSPFNLSGLGNTFFLEDFENGIVASRGLQLYGNQTAVVLAPSEFTDSVDEDDGEIDGSGAGGYSLLDSGAVIFFPTGIPIFVRDIGFQFNASELGFLPTAFGFVWTDGHQDSNVAIVAWSGEGKETLDLFPALVGDGSPRGETSDDRFFGINRPDGLSRIIVRTVFQGSDARFEIDHVQYGLFLPFVPEPTTEVMVLIAVVLCIHPEWYGLPQIRGRFPIEIRVSSVFSPWRIDQFFLSRSRTMSEYESQG